MVPAQPPVPIVGDMADAEALAQDKPRLGMRRRTNSTNSPRDRIPLPGAPYRAGGHNNIINDNGNYYYHSINSWHFPFMATKGFFKLDLVGEGKLHGAPGRGTLELSEYLLHSP